GLGEVRAALPRQERGAVDDGVEAGEGPGPGEGARQVGMTEAGATVPRQAGDDGPRDAVLGGGGGDARHGQGSTPRGAWGPCGGGGGAGGPGGFGARARGPGGGGESFPAPLVGLPPRGGQIAAMQGVEARHQGQEERSLGEGEQPVAGEDRPPQELAATLG